MNRKYLNIALAFVGVITIFFVVVIVTKKKATPVTSNNAPVRQSKEQAVNEILAFNENLYRADVENFYDKWAASGYPGEFDYFIMGR